MEVDEHFDKNLFIIKSVEAHPCLYDKSNDNYKRKDKRLHAWEEIVNLYQDCFKEHETAKKIKGRWQSLKKMFTAEHKKANAYVPSGSAAPEEEVCKFHYYYDMMFMDNHVKHRRTEGNFKFASNNYFAHKEDAEYSKHVEMESTKQKGPKRQKIENAMGEEDDSIEELSDDECVEEFLKCNQSLNMLLDEENKACGREESKPLRGYVKEIVKAFEALPEERKLKKFNEIMNIIEDVD